jgi:hypothetical protein
MRRASSSSSAADACNVLPDSVHAGEEVREPMAYADVKVSIREETEGELERATLDD